MAWDKTPSQKEAVKAFLVTTDGKADLEASCEKYRQVCLSHIAGQTAEQDLVASCMTELFDFRRGVTLNLDYIKSQTVQLMVKREPSLADPTLFAMLSGRVEDYLHSHCNYPATEAKGKRPAKEAVTGQPYSVKHGLGGGFYRDSDASKG